MEVDINGFLNNRVNGFLNRMTDELRKEHIRYTGARVLKDNSVQLDFKLVANRDAAMPLLRTIVSDLVFEKKDSADEYSLIGRLSAAAKTNSHDYTSGTSHEYFKKTSQ